MSTATQASFAAALLDRTKAVPPGLVSWSSEKPAKRFGVYRNNVSSGLVQALAIRFPAAEAIVGKEFFGAMARAYIEEYPPHSPILLHYGAGVADFIATFKPAAGVPYLADIVRLENARVEAYHATDMASMAPETLAAICSDRAGDLRSRVSPLICTGSFDISNRDDMGHELGRNASWPCYQLVCRRCAGGTPGA